MSNMTIFEESLTRLLNHDVGVTFRYCKKLSRAFYRIHILDTELGLDEIYTCDTLYDVSKKLNELSDYIERTYS